MAAVLVGDFTGHGRLFQFALGGSALWHVGSFFMPAFIYRRRTGHNLSLGSFGWFCPAFAVWIVLVAIRGVVYFILGRPL